MDSLFALEILKMMEWRMHYENSRLRTSHTTLIATTILLASLNFSEPNPYYFRAVGGIAFVIGIICSHCIAYSSSRISQLIRTSTSTLDEDGRARANDGIQWLVLQVAPVTLIIGGVGVFVFAAI